MIDFLPVLAILAFAAPAMAQSNDSAPPAREAPTVAFHVGAMTPLITRGASGFVTPPDSLMTMVPFGVLVMRGPLMFDTELMPMVTTDPQAVDLTVAPGFIYALSPEIYVGARSAFELKSGRVGVTPLFHYNLVRFENTNLFTEIVLPVRTGNNAAGDRVNSVGLAIAFGALFL